MEIRQDTVWISRGLKFGEFYRVTIDLENDECSEASLATIPAALLASLIPVVGNAAAAQFAATGIEIMAKNRGFGVVVRLHIPLAAIFPAFNEVTAKWIDQDALPGPFSSIRVEATDHIINEKITDDGWYRLTVDANLGAKGDYLYIQCKPYKPEDGEPISELTILNSSKNNIETPEGFEKVPTDLNKGAKGDYIYLYFKKGPNAINGLGIIAGDEAGIAPPEGFIKIDVDLNKGSKGKFIYLCYQPG